MNSGIIADGCGFNLILDCPNPALEQRHRIHLRCAKIAVAQNRHWPISNWLLENIIQRRRRIDRANFDGAIGNRTRAEAESSRDRRLANPSLAYNERQWRSQNWPRHRPELEFWRSVRKGKVRLPL